MTNGEMSGTNGNARVAVAIFAVVVAAITVINVASIAHEQPDLAIWKAWVWEGSSAVAVISILWLPWLVLQAAPLDRWRSPKTWAAHLGGALAWSILHVGGFLIIRHGVYGLLGKAYDYGDLRVQFPYEASKDVFSYAMAVSTFWLARRLRGTPEQPETATPSPPATFDIADGQRVIRTPVIDILAATSAGNYVEFHLADGRKPLMRASLASVEAALTDRGFVRTHRSWLVNAARVTGLAPAGSGDWTIELGGLEAPLSRRFPEALALLRGG